MARVLTAVPRVLRPEHVARGILMGLLAGVVLLVGVHVARFARSCWSLDGARAAYEEEKDSGAGLAEEQEGHVYDFFVSPVPPLSDVKMRYLYYQRLQLDTGIGRFLYPLEEGGNDELAKAFWSTNSAVVRSFSFHAVVQSAWPIEEVRMPVVPFVSLDARSLNQSGESLGSLPLLAFRPEELNRDGVIYQARQVSIGVFGIESARGTLTPRQWVPTRGAVPRYFAFGPAQRFLYVANQGGDSIIAYKVGRNGLLAPTRLRTKVGSPTCIVFSR